MPLGRASQIRGQKQRQHGWKLYSWHAPETECIGIGKVRAPYEFGDKSLPRARLGVPLTNTNKRYKGGQFILHAKALPGNPYDGHTLKDVLEETQALTGREIERAVCRRYMTLETIAQISYSERDDTDRRPMNR